MKVMLHTCCAPCLIYPFERLKQEGFEVTGFFYNPNIHPPEEHEKRRKAVEGLGRDLGVEVDFPQYTPQDFLQAVDSKKDSPQRCSICWSLRLKATAKAAKEKGFEYISTTLLVSPYQDQEKLKDIGKQAAEEQGVEFYYEDFRPGFRNAHRQAKEKGIYCQKYCGCIYSYEIINNSPRAISF
ncbi:epoxyqueuosine reductase QueH [Candidatus Omnitrophota bacterium]